MSFANHDENTEYNLNQFIFSDSQPINFTFTDPYYGWLHSYACQKVAIKVDKLLTLYKNK